MPQPVAPEGDDFFTALGAPVAFNQDRAALEKRFYEISRLLHPDRYSTLSTDAQRLSLARMSWVNQAYQTLRDPAELRDYYLKREGFKAPEGSPGARGSIPTELAESWFDLQDALAEDPDRARAKLTEFTQTLATLKQASDARLAESERKADEARSAALPLRPILEELQAQIRERGYLASIEKDVARIGERFK